MWVIGGESEWNFPGQCKKQGHMGCLAPIRMNGRSRDLRRRKSASVESGRSAHMPRILASGGDIPFEFASGCPYALVSCKLVVSGSIRMGDRLPICPVFVQALANMHVDQPLWKGWRAKLPNPSKYAFTG